MGLRIVYVITDLHVGGVPLHLFRLAKAMRDRGHSPVVVSLARTGEVSQRLVEAGVEVFHCNAAGAWDARAIFRLARFFRQLKPDVVHALLFHANVASRLAMRLARLPSEHLVCEIQTVEIERKWHLRVGGMTHRMGHCVIGNSSSVVEHLARVAHMDRHRLRCVHGGADVSQLWHAEPVSRESLGITGEEPLVCWVGRMDPIKGLEVLLEAFDQVVQRTPARLLLVGDGPLAAHVREVLTDRNLWGSVSMLGTRSDVPGILKSCQMFVLPSFTEGFPNALLEAMALGLPVVTSDVPGCHDLVTDGVNGLLAPAGDSERLADAIERVLGDDPLAKRLGAAAKDTVSTKYTMDRCVDRYLAVYEEIVGEAGGRFCGAWQ